MLSFKSIVVVLRDGLEHVEFSGHEIYPSNNEAGQLIIRDITVEDGEKKVHTLGVFNTHEWGYWMYINKDEK